MKMKNRIVPITYLETFPPEWDADLLSDIARQAKDSGTKTVVIDDDPTGTQTVHDMAVLTTWSVDALVRELEEDDTAFYILSNSRSLGAAEACSLAREIGVNLKRASMETGVDISVISRSDSTLRGHFPGEVDAMAETLETEGLPYLIIPFFFEGGRYTVKDIHYVADGGRLIPAAQTEFAKDAAFGFQNSDLKEWVAEKTGGRISPENVASVSINDIRQGGPERVTAILSGLYSNSACVVNAVSYRDLEVFVKGLLNAERLGRRFLYRTAASFVRVRTGTGRRALLSRDELISSNEHGGLFVIGSYVPKTTAQVAALLSQTDIRRHELNVSCLLDNILRPDEIARATDAVNTSVKSGQDTVLYTSRELIMGNDSRESLDIGRRVSDCLIEIIRGVRYQPRYLVAKGGITSSDVATKGLGVRRAMIMGQALPGVPVWKLGEESRYPGMAYIVFPGNVGDTDALAQILKRLET